VTITSRLHEKGILISGFAETITNWHHKNIKQNLSIATQSVFNNYSLAFSENRFNPPNHSRYLPGGCLQLCTDHWTSRLIETTKDPRHMTTISDPVEIEERLFACNLARFGQAQRTLFMTNRMQQLFGYSRVTKNAQEFHNKVFDKDNFPPLSRGATTLLTLSSNNTKLPPISTSISQEEFEKAFRKWSKGTSTSLSGRQLGHYRCLFADNGHTYTDNDPDPGKTIMASYYNIAMAGIR
jgi:hypothetical protein